jgi:hypothetical protein
MQKWGINSKQGLEFRNEHELKRRIHKQLSKQLASTLVRDQQDDVDQIERRFASSKYEPSLQSETIHYLVAK